MLLFEDSTFENRITNLTFEIPSLNCPVTLAIFFYNGDLRRCDREKMVYGLATSVYGLRLRGFLLVHSLTGFPAATFTRVISNARPTADAIFTPLSPPRRVVGFACRCLIFAIRIWNCTGSQPNGETVFRIIPKQK